MIVSTSPLSRPANLSSPVVGHADRAHMLRTGQVEQSRFGLLQAARLEPFDVDAFLVPVSEWSRCRQDGCFDKGYSVGQPPCQTVNRRSDQIARQRNLKVS